MNLAGLKCDVIKFTSDAITFPILLEVDTTYGSFKNVRRLARKQNRKI